MSSWVLKTGYTRKEVCSGGTLLHLWSQNHFTFMVSGCMLPHLGIHGHQIYFIYLRQFDVVNFPSFTLFLKAKLSGFVYFSLLRH
jgi:hypothetical protein